MMSFCKKTVHSFLSLSQSTSTISDYPSHHHGCLFPSTTGCFCLIAGDAPKPPNVYVLESASIKRISTHSGCKKDSATFVHLNNVCNWSCTESLGFESSAYPMEESLEEEDLLRSRSMAARSRWKTTVAKVRTQKTNFPPPLPSLNQKGHPCFFLKPLRRDGRLELTEVRIERPEIFMASREDGRLRLQLIRSEPQHPCPPYQDCGQLGEEEPFPIYHHHHDQDEEEEIIEKQEEGREILGKQEEGDILEKQENDDEISDEKEEEEEAEEREGGKRLRQWNLERIKRRCQVVNDQRPHHLLYGATIV